MKHPYFLNSPLMSGHFYGSTIDAYSSIPSRTMSAQTRFRPGRKQIPDELQTHKAGLETVPSDANLRPLTAPKA